MMGGVSFDGLRNNAHRCRNGLTSFKARLWLGPLLWIVGLISIPVPVRADSLLPAAPYANEQLPDPRQEARAKALMVTIRCLVCQGQSIADSDAELAGDMRSMIRTRIAAGEPPEQIRTWLIGRYGDWVSFQPRVDPETLPLWLVPVGVIAMGLFVARTRFRRRQ